MKSLTDKQKKVLCELKKFISKNGYPPTIRELCEIMDLKSSATIYVHLDKLEEKGYIKKKKEKNRTIELLVPNEFDKKNDGAITIPLLDKVIDEKNDIKDSNQYIEVPHIFLNSKNEIFSLIVSDNSMVNVGILEKDIVIVEKTKTVNNGDIVVVNNNNEITVKTFYKEKNYIKLQPENDQLEPIISKRINIIGKVIGLYRKI